MLNFVPFGSKTILCEIFFDDLFMLLSDFLLAFFMYFDRSPRIADKRDLEAFLSAQEFLLHFRFIRTANL
jgi:hypothetical protein